jgi:hypothetical protein
MELIRIKSKQKVSEIAAKAGVVGYVWTITMAWFNISLNFDAIRTSGDQSWIHYYTFVVNNYWLWGQHHDYYDGPHCGFSLGFIHFSWSGDWCDKCMPPEDC